ncbi:MAG: NACHT domain-containing protein [Cyanobacteria bacterium J06648_10]
MTQPSNPQPSIADKISELVRQAVVPGGATVGGIGAFWELLINDEGEVVKAVASAVIGLGLSYGATLLKPSHRSAQRRIDHAGKLLDQTTDLMFAKITGFEGKYLLCQALDCEGVRSEGMRDRDGIFEPELKDVFVELKIDGNSRPPGFWDKMRRKPQIDVSRNQTLWDILALKHQKPYRQLAILAWGGFGKTTLLKHVAYRYGMGEAPPNAPNLVPVLLVLRKCRKQLLSAEPLDLPTLINEYHIPSLPESSRLQPVPPNWAKDMLRKGRALVMFDGFDEVPRDERPAVVRWLHEQMRQYGQSVFLVTSRPKAYRDESSAAQLAMAMPLWVQPFDDEQRRKFVLNWYQCQEVLKARRNTPEVRKVATNAAEDLLLQIESQPKLRDLSQNPLLLNMIATFHRLYPEAALPRRRVDLYRTHLRSLRISC